MSAARSVVFTPDSRKYTRVVFTRTVKLFYKGKIYGQYPARNLSQGGVFLEGDVALPVGEDCRLELYETGRHSSLILTFLGRIVRQEKDGVGVEFTSMGEDSFMFLQTMVLYSSDDPIGVAERFLEDFHPTNKTA